MSATGLSVRAFRCDGCGACCRRFWCHADEDDVKREPRIATECTRFRNYVTDAETGQRLYFPQEWFVNPGGNCPFQGGNFCTIYTNRPRECRDFDAGSEACRLARKKEGLARLKPVDGLIGKPPSRAPSRESEPEQVPTPTPVMTEENRFAQPVQGDSA